MSKFTYQKPSEQTVRRQTSLFQAMALLSTLTYVLALAVIFTILATPLLDDLSRKVHAATYFTAVALFVIGISGALFVIPVLRDRCGLEPLATHHLAYLKHLTDENGDVAEVVRKWISQGLTLRERDLDAIDLYVSSFKERQSAKDLLRELGSPARTSKQQDSLGG